MEGHGKIKNVREYEDPKAPKVGGTDLGPLGRLGGSAPKYREVLYDDNTKVTEKWDPETTSWVQINVDEPQAVADRRLAAEGPPTPKEPPARTPAQARRDEALAAKAEREERQAAAPTPKKTPEDVARTQAETDEAVARAAQIRAQTAGLNPTVTRATGGYDRSEGQTTPRTETVGQAQAKYDLDAAQAANTAAQQARENIIAQARLAVEQGHLSATQAHNQATEQIQRLQLQLDEQRNQLTQRGQDITAGVTQRGQDLGYAQGLAQAGTSFAGRLMQDWVPEGQAASFNNLLTSMGGKAIPTAPLPWGPDLPLQLARQAQTQAPAGFQLPPGPFKTPAAP